jgi:glycine dehydrogenase
MLSSLGYASLDEMIDAIVPSPIRLRSELKLDLGKGEREALEELRAVAAKNEIFRSYLGTGYYGTITPPVIQRNIIENPGWYTAYTPYQAEISQGRLEALLNFQTMVTDLTGMEIANASMLDEATACAEAMAMAFGLRKNAGSKAFLLSKYCHPQNIELIRTRATPLGIEVSVIDESEFDFSSKPFGVLLQYPHTEGKICDYTALVEKTHGAGAMVIMAADILSLALLKTPGEMGADIAVGSTQRFGVPMGFGGPHAAYLATRDSFKRNMPGRLVGVSRDAHGKAGYRLALQTREQHIRREKATSNICTAQVLLAVMASMYAVYHGPEGLRQIAQRTHLFAKMLATALRKLGYELGHTCFFDTVLVRLGSKSAAEIVAAAAAQRINIRVHDEKTVSVALDETVDDLAPLLCAFNGGANPGFTLADLCAESEGTASDLPKRQSAYLTHPVFNQFHTEHEMLRYLRRLESKDLSLTSSMIALGSCTMKLNATSQMFPVTWPEFSSLHPHVAPTQSAGYKMLAEQLESWLAEITGFSSVSLQPNAGSQGEFAGLLSIRGYHQSRGQGHRNVCLIPQSAHGTNPASAAMAGFKVVPVLCSAAGDIDIADLRAKAETHQNDLGALMVTYPSTHGVFEEGIQEICDVIHSHGGQVYMDGANMNAQVGLCRPGDFGADVCHLNLHKTFAIPHGGGGPGVGPICVAAHLAPFLPKPNGQGGLVSAAALGSASVLVISWMYIRMMGRNGLPEATKVAILNANYVANRLKDYFPIVFTGKRGLVAHECILDLRQFKATTAEDVAKRLMDYGFHAPTLSWPVGGTLMVEPTESESKAELDRFCEAMIAIHAEMTAVERGELDKTNNPLKNAPHTAQSIAGNWDRPYSRETAVFPSPWTRAQKFWPSVGRIDNVFGDRNLFCSCPPLEDYA